MVRGAEAVLARQGRLLPQVDQLCGPFAASVGLAALEASPPHPVEIALAAGTRILHGDHPQWRPPGAPLLTTGWDELPRASGPDQSGTDAAGLVAGLAVVRPDLVVVPAEGGGDVLELLDSLAQGRHRVAVLANLRTGPVAPEAVTASGVTWDVGHFVVLWGVDVATGRIAVADSYAELGEPGMPRGCRMVDAAALRIALEGRGLLLLTPAGRAVPALERLVAGTGFGAEVWAT